MKKTTKNVLNLTSILIIFLLSSMLFQITEISALVETDFIQVNVESTDSSSWLWSDTQVLSTESSDSSVYSDIAIDSHGNIHLAWQELTNYDGSGSDRDIFYKQWNYTTETWSLTEAVSTESTASSEDPSIGVDSEGNVHIAWVDYTDYSSSGTDRDIFYKRLETTGSWITTQVVSSGLSGEAENPSLAVDTSDNVHVAWEDNSDLGYGTDFDIVYKKMDGVTKSWGSAEVVSTESTAMSIFCSLDTDVLDNVHIAWTDSTAYDLSGSDWDVFYKNKNSFTTLWSTTEVVSSESDSGSFLPNLAMDSHGNIHIIWEDLTDYGELGSGYDIFYKKWDIYTSIWSAPTVLSPGSTGESQEPVIEVDNEDNLHVAWYDSSNQLGAGTDNDVFYRNWNFNSDEWSSIKLISTSSTNQSESPCVAVSDAGYVFITWNDLTDLPGIGEDEDIFMRYFAGVPDAPLLAYIEPNPTENNFAYLDWSEVTGAKTYHVYESDTFIFSVEGLTPIASRLDTEFFVSLENVGYRYFAVVAENFVGNSSISNCEFVLYTLPSLDEFIIISGWVFSTLIITYALVKKRRKKSDKN